ncbi:polyphosphate:AMP phosphotransferase [Candidatus Contendibacter odensensis]|uniref:Polyphosphate:AMP phosphotransferase n=1 Tax=Candidatus Contendobacter odensis Run_B_J11 TaxID=1400861 RepID=A0A7U7J207_9GAMM|nr:polyphosphate:AMP phosphotransferase [Candidatus Contendobacter odensis]CDH44428.1 putative polyphosphate:AMP phosphotransferase [Candidatus Contendobacter odensis Run_B_J11]
MFRTAELQRKLPKEDYHQQVPQLRQELLMMQMELRDAGFPVIVVFAGVDGAGKSETVNKLHEWMDSRWLITRAFGDPSDEERDRPEYWRFWRELPPNGRIGLFLSSWYSLPILDQVYGHTSLAEFDERLERIKTFEQTLANDGALILKFWMHLSKDAQKERLRKLEKSPLLHWQISKRDWRHWEMYDQFIAAAERTLMKTGTGLAPWKIVEGYDERYRSVTVATTLRDAIRFRLDEVKAGRGDGNSEATAHSSVPAVDPNGSARVTVLSHLDMSKTLAKDDYDASLKRYQAKLNQLQRSARDRKVSTLLMFEGWDAAGKGGSIRRITSALDARDYQVIQIAAPTDEEAAHNYLWRFWRHLPRAGHVTIYDRSWYGRVLVERIEGFARTREWQRAYAEINDFEAQLVESGIVLLKFWLHITPEEQLRRFQEREQIAYKAWKLTDEDWRNRERWASYELAVNDMVEHTSTRQAPWTLIEANDKRHTRIEVLRTLCERMEAALAGGSKSS